jgi:hypothetical protein
MNTKAAVKLSHWTFSVQQDALREHLIGGNPEFWVR